METMPNRYQQNIGESNPPPITIGDITLEGVLDVTDKGGVNAPEKKTERGFAWSSYVDSEPLEVEINALVPEQQYRRITSLRDEAEPVSASVAQVIMAQAVVESLTVTNTYKKQSHYEVSLTLREVRQSSTDTTTLTVATGNGKASGSAASENSQFLAGLYPEAGEIAEEVESSGSSDDSGDDENFVSDTIGDAANAISDAVGGIFDN